MKFLKALFGVILFIIACLLAPVIFGALVTVFAASLPLVGLMGIILIPGIIVGILIARK